MDPAQLDVFKTVKEITGQTLYKTLVKRQTLNSFHLTIRVSPQDICGFKRGQTA